MLIAGIEEAGRGPVVGPMVLCGVMIKEEKMNELMTTGVKDSKALTPERRTELFPKIKELAEKVCTAQITPEEIDCKTGKKNLNYLEAVKMAELIDELKPDKAIIDTPSPNLNSFKQLIKSLAKHKCEIICEHKADVNYPVVSASSIIAKVLRDKEITKLEKELKITIGSGYPSDPVTQKFLETYWKQLAHLPFVRNSWDTVVTLKNKKAQKNMADFF